VARLSQLIAQLESRIQNKLVHEIDLSEPDSLTAIIDEDKDHDLTLAGIAERFESSRGSEPIDRQWLRWITNLLSNLRRLRWQYSAGTTGRGRANAGILNSTGCSSVWGSTFPYNPYPFPWANHLFQDAASMAMGVFEGHMRKMADGFKAIRLAECELAVDGSGQEAEGRLTYFDWQQFSDEEWELCPPVIALGGDGAMYDIGFQNLSRAMMSGKPIKVLVLDTQVYSNTGGQACTSGFFGQISDMAQFGAASQGKQEVRKEIGLIGMAHRTTYVMQSTIAHPNHLIEGFIQGLKTRRPALFNLYTSCQPEHGIGDDMSAHQAKLVVESRAYPLFRYNPDLGVTPERCLDLDGNPAPNQDWPTYQLAYTENSRSKTMELPFTFADFAATEIRFRKHFRVAPQEAWNDQMILVHEYLELSQEDRQGRLPFIWSVNRQGELMRLLVAQPVIRSCEDRRDFWKMLRALARTGDPVPERSQIEAEIRREMSGRLTKGILQLLTGEAPTAVGSTPDSAIVETDGDQGSPRSGPGNGQSTSVSSTGYLAPWIDTPACTSCGECIKLNPDIFQYNQENKAIIKNPQGGPYRDLVKAAERCTAQIIHPGLPKDRSEKDIEKWIARAEKYNR
jgi:pyruvate-ferredoxin/flavodoxin oxidoreductase